MLNVDIDVVKGVTFIRLEGNLTYRTFDELDFQIDNLLYNLEMHFYVINFVDVSGIENNILDKLQNKLYEIFLSCGDVVMCGINNIFKDKRVVYINNEVEAFKYFRI